MQVRVALDVTAAMGRRPTGVSRAIRGTLRGLRAAGGDAQFILCGRASRWRPWRRVPSVPGFRRKIFGDRLPGSIDLFHGMDVRLPGGEGVPLVSTFHDLSALHEGFTSPEFRDGRIRQWRDAVRRASRIVTYSRYVKDEVADRFSVPGDRVSVVPLGVDPVFHDGAHVQVPGLPDRYILTVGGISRRKGTVHLLRAMPEVPLVICGRDGYGGEEVRPESDRIIRLGYVPDDGTLAALYSHAEAVVLPSLYEGFGLSALEAMACGSPVITTRAGAVPEVVGDAARLVPPGDVPALREAIREVLEDADLRADLARRGRERAARFRWEETGSALLEVYGSALAS